ncbi:MAG TPA: hypothetical protein VMW10_12390 [Alphaproteobacteria bacterium]|nr:hypothetical protein [Alphaproteobacteria bacterium]
MREFLIDLKANLEEICPTFLQVPPKTPYPYITLEPGHYMQGFPWGPLIVTLTIKIWSDYAGTKEILSLGRAVEKHLKRYTSTAFEVSLKIDKSSLLHMVDEQIRVHTIGLKARLRGDFS